MIRASERRQRESKAASQPDSEEKWEIGLEGLRGDNIAQTCWRYGIAPNLYYRRKDAFLRWRGRSRGCLGSCPGTRKPFTAVSRFPFAVTWLEEPTLANRRTCSCSSPILLADHARDSSSAPSNLVGMARVLPQKAENLVLLLRVFVSPLYKLSVMLLR